MESLPMTHHSEKSGGLFLPPASSKVTCVKLQNDQVSIMHHAQLPYPLPRKIIQHSPWEELKPLSSKTEKHK
jgi:hypothetical protein